MMIFLQHPFKSEVKCLDFELDIIHESDVRNAVLSKFGYQDFSLYCNGRKVQNTEVISQDSTVYVTFTLPGGKGGFGSMLRAIGAQIEKTTNREACRDLSGRRLRDINEEQRLKKWIAKEAEREAEKLKRRKARIERLKTRPAHKFFDFEYEKEISQVPERVNDALNEGLQKTKQPTKRPAEEAGSSKPPKKTWLSDEFLSSSDSDSEINTSENESSSAQQKNNSVDSDMSDISQPGPSCSKSQTPFESEESSHFNSDSVLSVDSKSETETLEKAIDTVQFENAAINSNRDISSNNMKNQSKESSYSDFRDVNMSSIDTVNIRSSSKIGNLEESKPKGNSRSEEVIDSMLVYSKVVESAIKSNTTSEEINEDSSPIELLDFQSVSDLEVLGLNRLKSELMYRGLKCGGSLSDRAKRLWQVRDLLPNEYPAILLAKNKK